MISFVRGELDHTAENSVVIDCNGVGYNIYMAPAAIAKLFGKKDVKIYTYQSVKDDGITLFGFLSHEELRMFERLITVTGLGPKGGIGLLSSLRPQEITLAILTDDAEALTKAPGIGKKTAQRIILDLKDKLKNDDAFTSSAGSPQESFDFSGSEKSDAAAALTALGYGRSDALKAVLAVAVDGMSVEQIIKAALRKISSL